MPKLNPTSTALILSVFVLFACQKDASYINALGKTLVIPDAVEDPNYGAESNPTGDAIGGGFCYSDVIEQGDYLVYTATDFLEALDLAVAGETILVAEGAEIDLSGIVNLKINKGITLAGNRGQCLTRGPLIFNNEMPQGEVWFWVGQDVRITGLRFSGPDDPFDEINYDLRPAKSSICFAVGEANVEIDNCEISKFSRGGIEVYPDGKNVYIHHNFLHDIHAYPVITVNRSSLPVLIEANLIYWVWHATAGSGVSWNGL